MAFAIMRLAWKRMSCTLGHQKEADGPNLGLLAEIILRVHYSVQTGVFVISKVTGKPFPHGHLDGPNVISRGTGQRDLFDVLANKLK
eukprot:scaffold168251_cov17-Prasinocladus_malaysianus.AAC.1